MPYDENSELPLRLRRLLPDHAQSIYREAFNHAWKEYTHMLARREEIAHRVAWSAVKKRYEKSVSGQWQPIGDGAECG